MSVTKTLDGILVGLLGRILWIVPLDAISHDDRKRIGVDARCEEFKALIDVGFSLAIHGAVTASAADDFPFHVEGAQEIVGVESRIDFFGDVFCLDKSNCATVNFTILILKFRLPAFDFAIDSGDLGVFLRDVSDMAFPGVLDLGFDKRCLVFHGLYEICHVSVSEQLQRFLFSVSHELALPTLEGGPILDELGNLCLDPIAEADTLMSAIFFLAVEKHFAVPRQ
ncbi:hypothetical protein FOB41_07495 [Agrobacterium pusense]|uniref:Uncharacterized protein n=1 Tax=Agrobacterium pusense TaxID=648995 RepID=A0A6H0ZJG8_9HYPH|nr:hypothetical protein [Agrobacterium pusense]QIX20985.1 hypothetical protein FOB41_07495 [Agrobacterium pusense]